MPLIIIDGMWSDDNLAGGQRTLRATTRTVGLAALAVSPRLLQSARYAVFAPFEKAPTTIQTIIARVERGFAHFAQIPYQGSLTQRDFSRFLDDFEAEFRSDRSD
jgi:hypothetical protein